MVYLGAPNAVASDGVTKEVCDLYSEHYIGWVRDQRENLDVEPVERAAATASVDGRKALMFFAGGVRPVAQDLADSLGVVLLVYEAQDGSLDGGNSLGRLVCSSGLSPA